MASLRMTFELKESILQGEKFRAQRTVSTEPSGSRELSAIREYKGQRVVMELKQQEGERERGREVGGRVQRAAQEVVVPENAV